MRNLISYSNESLSRYISRTLGNNRISTRVNPNSNSVVWYLFSIYYDSRSDVVNCSTFPAHWLGISEVCERHNHKYNGPQNILCELRPIGKWDSIPSGPVRPSIVALTKINNNRDVSHNIGWKDVGKPNNGYSL